MSRSETPARLRAAPLLIAFLGAIVTACGGSGGTSLQGTENPPGSGIIFSVPQDGTTLSQPSVISVSGDRVTSATFLVDGNVEYTDQSAPYEWTLNPESYAAGSHVLEVSVQSDLGESSVSVQLTLVPPITGPIVPSAFADFAEGSQALDDGATRDYYNRAAVLPWRNPGGDWHDVNGVAQGSAPYATAQVQDNDTQEWVEWDVTNLVNEWLDGTHPNRGFMLRGGSYHFNSRQNPDEATRPQLVLSGAAGNTTLPAASDVAIDKSTYQGFGDAISMNPSSGGILIRFDLTEHEGTTVDKATLRLFKNADYGGDGSVTVFRLSQGHNTPAVPVETGIAANYAADAGIGNDPDVVLFANFEDANWTDAWSYGQFRQSLSLVESDSTYRFEQFQGKALKVVIEAGDVTGMNMGYQFTEETGSDPEEMYFRYYLRVSDWPVTEGGKLPGFSGTYDIGGWGGAKSDGTNGWSARGLFTVPPSGNNNPLKGYLPIGNYLYHADMEGWFGDHIHWTDDYRGYLAADRWYCIEQYVKMNDPNGADGVLRAWVDGKLTYNRTNLRYRTIDTLKIERLWMNVYHGGVTPVSKDAVLYIDNVVIAKKYIGPINR